jgi:hypothetical protein
MLAHGGTAGLFIEASAVLGLSGTLVIAWLLERRQGRRRTNNAADGASDENA